MRSQLPEVVSTVSVLVFHGDLSLRSFSFVIGKHAISQKTDGEHLNGNPNIFLACTERI